MITDMSRPVPRLSATERLILDLLRQGEGYVESRTEPLSPGAIGLQRRWYRPTAYGLRVSNAWILAARSFAEQELRTGAA